MELIVAFAKNGVIGNNNKIPWYIPEDLLRFKHITLNNVIVMGRKTFESFPNGPLKDRIHIVLTRNADIYSSPYPNVFFVNTDNLEKMIELFIETKKIFVIGGKEIYDLLMDSCKTFHITLIDAEPVGDTLFSYNLGYFFKNYELVYESKELISNKHGVKYTYYTFCKN